MQAIRIRQSDGTLRRYKNAGFIPAFPMINMRKARSATEALDLTVESLCVEPGELERYARLQNPVPVLYDIFLDNSGKYDMIIRG